MKLEKIAKQEVEVAYLHADMGVRYWEDASVNGVDEGDDPTIPLAEGDSWRITIELATGRIVNWPAGVTASTHYKVCDAGVYQLLDAQLVEVAVKDGYVPKMLSPGGNGYGDYVIMTIDGDGKIEDWKADLSYFAPDEE
jgi:hypothetical protein